MKPDLKGEARRWFLQAVQDLDDAEFIFSGKRYNVSCFLAQQAAEKVLKAYLLAIGAEEVWGYSVADLCRDIVQIDKSFVNWQERIAPLDKYYIPTRYPNALPGGIPAGAFDENDARRALELAREIIEFVKLKGALGN